MWDSLYLRLWERTPPIFPEGFEYMQERKF
jgi:hypothetical protein